VRIVPGDDFLRGTGQQDVTLLIE